MLNRGLVVFLAILCVAVAAAAYVGYRLLMPTVAATPSPAAVDHSAPPGNATTTPAKAPKGISEEAIAAKTVLGITREQAIEIINNQAAHDADLAKAAAKETKAKK